MDLPYDQHLSVKYDGDDLIREAMKVSVGNIKSETLSDSVFSVTLFPSIRISLIGCLPFIAAACLPLLRFKC